MSASPQDVNRRRKRLWDLISSTPVEKRGGNRGSSSCTPPKLDKASLRAMLPKLNTTTPYKPSLRSVMKFGSLESLSPVYSAEDEQNLAEKGHECAARTTLASTAVQNDPDSESATQTSDQTSMTSSSQSQDWLMATRAQLLLVCYGCSAMILVNFDKAQLHSIPSLSGQSQTDGIAWTTCKSCLAETEDSDQWCAERKGTKNPGMSSVRSPPLSTSQISKVAHHIIGNEVGPFYAEGSVVYITLADMNGRVQKGDIVRSVEWTQCKLQPFVDLGFVGL